MLARIAGVQRALSLKHDRRLIKLGSKLRHDLDEILDREEVMWYQKSRVEWLKNGDRNTTFFHLSTIARRWKNKITAIKNEIGDWLYEKELVKNHIVNYFTDLFTEAGDCNLQVVPQDVFPELSLRDWRQIN